MRILWNIMPSESAHAPTFRWQALCGIAGIKPRLDILDRILLANDRNQRLSFFLLFGVPGSIARAVKLAKPKSLFVPTP